MTEAQPRNITTDPPDSSRPSPAARWTLIAVLAAVVVVPTSISGTGVALPAIGEQTGASLAELQWVVNAFNLTFACFTLAWGSVADVIGRARAFTAGAALYAAASVLSAAAGNVVLLDIGRALAGVGGAAIFAAGSAILSTIFTGARRTQAFALFGTVAGIGVGVGPLVSGVLVEAIGWRSIFVLHAVIVLAVLAVSPVVIRATGHTRNPDARVDYLGTAVFVLALLSLMTAIVQGAEWGWASAGVLGLIVLAVVLGGAFVVVERKVASPMLELSVLSDRRFVGLCLITVAASFGFVTMLTYLPSYITAAGGRSGTVAGLVMMLLTLPVFVCPLLASRLVNRGVSADALLYLSLGCFVVGDLALLLFEPSFSVAVVAVPMIVVGVGMGISTGLVDGQALAAVDPARAGMAAGVLNTMRLGSEAIAVAVYASVLATLVRSEVADGLGRFAPGAPADVVGDSLASGNLAGAGAAAGNTPDVTGFLVGAYDTAFHTMLWTLSAVCLILGLTIVVLIRKPARTQA